MWQGIDRIIKGLGARSHMQETRPTRPAAPGGWPGVVAQWRPGRAPASIEVRLRRAAVRDRVGSGQETPWEGIAASVDQPGLTVSLTSSFLAAPAVLEATAVARLQEFVVGCRDTMDACTFLAELPAVAVTSDAVCRPLDLRLELRAAPAPAGPQEGAPAPTDEGAPAEALAGPSGLAQEPALEPAPPAEPQWLRLEPAFPPPLAGEPVAGAASAFATAFRAAYPGWRVALRESEDGAGRPGHGAAARGWAVAESVTKLRRRPGEARCFAPRPVSTELLSAEGVRLEPFPPAEHEPEPIDLQGFDADLLLEGFLADLEQVLRSPWVAGRRPRAGGGGVAPRNVDRHERLVDRLLVCAGELVEALGERVARVFAGAPGEGLDEATQAYVDAVRGDLRQAYAVSGIVLLDLDADVPCELHLLGEVGLRHPGGSNLQVTAGRLRLRPGEPGRLCVLVGRRGADGADGADGANRANTSSAHGGYADVAARLVVTHVARAGADVDVRVGEDGEEHVAWLRLVPLETEEVIDLGDEPTRVPLPVRRFPVPPTLESAAAGAALKEPATLEEACGWRYEFSYRPGADSDAGADRVRVTVAYEPEASAPEWTPAGRARPRPDLLAPLASWRAAGPAVLAQLAAGASGASGHADDATCAALGYVAWAAAAVAGALCVAADAASEAAEPQCVGAAPDRFQLREREGVPAVRREPGTERHYVALRQDGGGPIAVGPARALDVRRLTAAHVAVQLERNAELVPGRATASDFVYRVDPLGFPAPIRPLLEWPKPIVGPTVSAAAASPGASSDATELREAIGVVLEDLLGPTSPDVDASIEVRYAFPAGREGEGLEMLAQVPLGRMLRLPRTANGQPDLAGLGKGLTEAIARELPAGIVAAGAGILVDTTVLVPVPGSDPVPVLHVGVWLPLVGEAPEELGPQYV